MRLLEFSIRQSLDDTTARGMAVLKPLKVTITNFSEAVSSWESQRLIVLMGVGMMTPKRYG